MTARIEHIDRHDPRDRHDRARSLARRISWLGPWIVLVAALFGAAPASAAPKEASERFSRGVALYNETDYRAALVEFKRAYELAPNPSVLYNIGQTYFQLQNYAAALTTFERYLAESGPGAAHRAEVAQSVETLRTRVGKLVVKTNRPDIEITIDDEPVGRTPLDRPLLVSIGRRKIVATLDGQPAQSRSVEIVAGETASLSLSFTDAGASAGSDRPRKPPGPGRIYVGWTATGVLAAGALTMGTLAFLASRDLDDLKGSFPTSPEALDDKASRVTTFSIAADVLGVAAIAAGGVTLYMMRSRSRARATETRVGLSPRGLLVSGRF
jgi:hypothetical protein